MSGPPGVPLPPTDGDVNHGNDLNGIIWLFASLTTLVYVGRVYSRMFLTRNLGWDDAILALSMALLYIQCAFVSVSVHYGLGRHQYYILMSNPLNISTVVKWQLFSQPVAILGTTMPKIAVTMLLIKLLDPSKISKIFLWGMNIVLNIISFVCIVTSFAQCTPASTYWTREGGKCWDPSIVANLGITQGALSAFTDFALALFPLTVVLQLQMPLMRKIAVCLLMGFGCFAGVAAIIRTSKLARLGQQEDFTWHMWTLVLWVGIECCVIITCACVPSMRPLFRKVFDKPFSSTFPSIFSKRPFGSRSKSYMMGSAHNESYQTGSFGSREPKSSMHSSQDGSQVNFAREPRFITTADVQGGYVR